jgi:hypothetical protein
MRTKLLGATTLLLCLGLSACGGGDVKEKKTGASDVDLQLKYAKCMRDNGVDIPDPKADGSGMVVLGGGADAKSQAAIDKCKQYLPNGGEPKKMSPEELAAMVKYAQCMRKNGIDMPDPNPNGMTRAQPAGDPAHMAKVDKAAKACEQFMPGASG